jgi:hypothetical protein
MRSRSSSCCTQLGRDGRAARLNGFRHLSYAPREQRAVPHHLAVGERELPALAGERLRTVRILTKLRTRPVERQPSIFVRRT